MSFEKVKHVTTQYLILLVFIVGCISTITLLENPSSSEGSSRLLGKDRSPASLGSRPDQYPVEVVDWDCRQRQLKLPSVTQVRLRLHPCQKTESDSLSTEVTNTTTGFAATVFKAPERADLTTDFITLAGGENHIHIEHVLKNGRRTARDLSIVTN